LRNTKNSTKRIIRQKGRLRQLLIYPEILATFGEREKPKASHLQISRNLFSGVIHKKVGPPETRIAHGGKLPPMLKLWRAGKAERKTVTSDWPTSVLPGARYEVIFTPLEMLPRCFAAREHSGIIQRGLMPRSVSGRSTALTALSMAKGRNDRNF
jgi:hypothetical protein